MSSSWFSTHQCSTLTVVTRCLQWLLKIILWRLNTEHSDVDASMQTTTHLLCSFGMHNSLSFAQTLMPSSFDNKQLWSVTKGAHFLCLEQKSVEGERLQKKISERDESQFSPTKSALLSGYLPLFYYILEINQRASFYHDALVLMPFCCTVMNANARQTSDKKVASCHASFVLMWRKSKKVESERDTECGATWHMCTLYNHCQLSIRYIYFYEWPSRCEHHT